MKLPLALLLFVCALPQARAAGYGMAGCGVGSLLFGDSPSAFGQVLAVTTNDFYMTQSFSITSGTSNCRPTGRDYALQRQEQFLEANLAMVAKESARGDGPLLAAYAETFGCDARTVPAFKADLQSAYDRIYSEPGSHRILAATHRELSRDAQVKAGCTNVF